MAVRCCAFVHIIKWNAIAVVFQASMVSANWPSDWRHLSDLEGEATTTTRVGLTNHVLETLHKGINRPLKYVLMSRFVLLVAVMLLGIWHLSGFLFDTCRHHRNFKEIRFVHYWIHNKSVRQLLLGVIVMQFYYADGITENFGIVRENPFTCSCVFLFADSILFKLFGDVIIKGKIMKITPRVTGAKKVNDVYTKISNTLEQPVMHFFVQFALVLFYVYSLNDKSEFKRVQDVSYVKWMVAVFLTVIVGNKEAGAEFDFEFWETLYLDPLGLRSAKLFYCIDVPLRYQWRTRAFFSFCVNLLFRQMILVTAPVMLSITDPMDFIKDALAVFFITKLDDLDDVTDLETVKKELRKVLEHNEHDATGWSYGEVGREVQTAISHAFELEQV